MGNDRLPQFIVISSNEDTKMYASYNNGSFIQLKEGSIFSDLVKIEVQQSTTNPKCVNLLFPAFTKYWHEGGESVISAASDEPRENTSKASLCTLFEVTMEAGDGNGDDGTFNFYLTHFQYGGRLSVDPKSSVFKIEDQPPSASPGTLLTGKDWSRLVKLPEHVAFKGAEDGGQFIQFNREVLENRSYLRFIRKDPYFWWKGNSDPYVYDQLTENKVILLPDGHMRIKSDFNGKLWRRAPDDYITVDGDPETPLSDLDYLFWPVKIDDQTIALRNAGNNKYCQRITAAGPHNALSAGASTVVDEAKLQVKEVVSKRKIYNVRYRIEEARIFQKEPYDGGTTLVTNPDDKEAVMEVVEFFYLGEEYGFSKRFYVEAGVASSIEAGIPKIVDAYGKIEVNPTSKVKLSLGRKTGVSRRVEVKGSVTVPAKSVAEVSYVGTKGTYDVPFSYTQQDTSYVDGGVAESEQDDGIYTGSNSYNFNFVITKLHPLGYTPERDMMM